MFWYMLLALLVLFAVMFFAVRSGWLTISMVAIDAALVQAKPLFESVIDFDFTHILTAAQQGWLIFTATLLVGVARLRSAIKDGVGLS